MSLELPDLDNLSPGSLVNIGSIVDDVLNLFPGDTIPASSVEQMTIIVGKLSMLGGIVAALQNSLEPVTDALFANNTAPYKQFDAILQGIGVHN